MNQSDILRRLALADRSWLKTRSLERLLRSVKHLCAGLVLLAVLDLILQLASHVRLGLSLLTGLSLATLLAWHTWRAWISRSPLLRTARYLESRDDSLGSRPVNVLQLAEKADDPGAPELTRALARRAVDEASDELGNKEFLALTKSPTMKRTAWRAALPVVLVLLPSIYFAPVAWREALRFGDPYGDHPAFSMTHLEIVTPASDGGEVVYRKSTTIEAESTGHRPQELFLTLDDPARPGHSVTVPMFPAGERKFVQQIDEVTTDLVVRAHTRNKRSVSQGREIKVLLTPQIVTAAVAIQPPAYTKLSKRET